MRQKLSEFEIINTFFKEKTLQRNDVLLGIGDDAALLAVPKGKTLVVAVDTLVAGIHFLPNTPADVIAHKALAVNLSDLAAMGADPAWMTLALTMPTANNSWLKKFSSGLFQLAKKHHVQLIGGDTTRGPLSITISVYGFLPSKNKALCRKGAKVGDKIYVSGSLGNAGLALQLFKNKKWKSKKDKKFLLQKLNKPEPRVKLGALLRGIASSAIDISDGLLADLGHILEASKVGAVIDTNQLPISATMKRLLPPNQAKKLALTFGDDYELCFTVSSKNEKKILSILKKNKIQCHPIGKIKSTPGIKLKDYSLPTPRKGYIHWR